MKIQGFSTSLISNFGLSKWDSKETRENDFKTFKINFPAQNPKSRSNLRFLVLRCRFLSFGNRFWISIPQIQNRNRIWGFEVPILYFSEFWCADFLFFWKFQKLWKIEIIQILAESVSAFSSNFGSTFLFFRV